MSCLGIDVSSTVQGSELEHITVEGIEATDALGRAICQSQLRQALTIRALPRQPPVYNDMWGCA